MNSLKSFPSVTFSDSHKMRVERDVNEMPVVFLPESSDLECVAQNRMSSFGFLAFVIQSVNAVVNVANNINNNNNNRNNNNNDNNNNQVNTNIANSANEQSSMSMAGMGRGVRIMERIREARDRVMATITGEEEEEEMSTRAAQIDKDEYRAWIEQRVMDMMTEMYNNKKEEEDPVVRNVSSSAYPEEILSMMEDVRWHLKTFI